MTRRLVTAAVVLAVALPALGTAQERPRDRDRDRDTWREAPVRVFSFNRARIGVTVQTEKDEETDRYGAKIVSVVEDGPADDAGLKAGDIITRFNSTSLANAKPEDMDIDSDGSGPGLRLVELARELDEGDTVRVEYRRDGNTRSATIVAEEMESSFSFNRMTPNAFPRFEGPNGTFEFFGAPGRMEMFKGPGNVSVFIGNTLGLQMIELDSDLGEYFGTSEGLLIIDTPEDSTLPFRAGDVILTLDGRKPTSVSHAHRIIRSYEEGETIRAEIMRKQQRMNVEWKVKPVETRVRELRPSGRLERTPARSSGSTRM